MIIEIEVKVNGEVMKKYEENVENSSSKIWYFLGVVINNLDGLRARDFFDFAGRY